MTNKNRPILVVSAIAITCMAYAETPTGNPDTFKLLEKVQKGKDVPEPGRPKKPAMNKWISVEIYKGVLTIEFPSDAESGVVTIGTGDFVVFSAAIDRMDNTVELPPLSGEFLLSVAFDNGDVYEGEIFF